MRVEAAACLEVKMMATSGGWNFGPEAGAPVKKEKKRGDLAKTLDPLLKPRVCGGNAGRPPGAVNYTWTAADDEALRDLCGRYSPAKVKQVFAKRLSSTEREVTVSPDALRKAVERRMEKLGLKTGRPRATPRPRVVKRWTAPQVAALLGSIGEDASLETIAARTQHSVAAVRAKMARLDYEIGELAPGVSYTVAELAVFLMVSPRMVRRWREKQWLQTNRRRITENCLQAFVRAHPDQISFERLPQETQLYLIDLGYPSTKIRTLRANVRSIVEGIGRDRKTPRRPSAPTSNADPTTGMSQECREHQFAAAGA